MLLMSSETLSHIIGAENVEPYYRLMGMNMKLLETFMSTWQTFSDTHICSKKKALSWLKTNQVYFKGKYYMCKYFTQKRKN